jgi:hypothetical protein
MTIGQLASRTGLTVRTPRFYADAGVIPELERTDAEYCVFGPDAVPRARLVRTLRRRAGGAAARDGISPDSPTALAVIERLEAMAPGTPVDTACLRRGSLTCSLHRLFERGQGCDYCD